jgi:acetyl esterase/lipase
VVVHGGGWLEGDRSSFASRQHGAPGNIEDFAALGFVAVTVNYRLSEEELFPAALEDCNSAGGHLALLLGMVSKDAGVEGDGPHQEESSVVQAAVSDSGPLDLPYQYQHGTLKHVVSKFMGGAPEGERAALYSRGS